MKSLRNHIRKIISENIQLADKIYFKIKELSEEDKNLILKITNGDNYTKLISDIYFYLKKYPYKMNGIEKTMTEYYNQLKNYDKNIFPINGFNNIDKVEEISKFVCCLDYREKLLKLYDQLPSIAIRNLKDDIKKPRDCNSFGDHQNDLDYFVTHLQLLSNKNEEAKNKIYQKMFKSNISLEDLLRFVEEKENLIGGYDITKDEVLKLVSDNNDMELLFDKNNVLIVKVESPEAIKEIGCNSLWCFTYGTGFDSAYRQWYNYSTNNMVYVIIDFKKSIDDPDFMNVVIKPIDFKNKEEEINDEKIYDLKNEPQYNPIRYLQDTIGISNAKKLLTFKIY